MFILYPSMHTNAYKCIQTHRQSMDEFGRNRSVGQMAGSSPDLNPIEHCWTVVKKKVSDLRPTGEQDLIQKLKTVWAQEITEEYCRTLIDSMPNRIQAVLKAQGETTRY